jgi:hypothetical protein
MLVFVLLCLGASACMQLPLPLPLPVVNVDASHTPILQPTSTFTRILPTLTFTSTPIPPPELTLDKTYVCYHGPGENYNDIVDFPQWTVLPIIGTNGAGWWLVAIRDTRTDLTECWINGGVASGSLQSVPEPTLPNTFLQVHDNSDPSRSVLMECSELDQYRWVVDNYSVGRYLATHPFLGLDSPMILRDEWGLVCPDWQPRVVVQVRDRITWVVIGYLTCPELENYTWRFSIVTGIYVASVPLFGNQMPAIYLGDTMYICPSFRP